MIHSFAGQEEGKNKKSESSPEARLWLPDCFAFFRAFRVHCLVTARWSRMMTRHKNCRQYFRLPVQFVA